MGDAVLADLASKVVPGIPVLFLDTGYHFVETIGTRDAVEATLNVKMLSITPVQSVAEQDATYGKDLYKTDPDLCCQLRKVQPLAATLDNFDAWATGLRRAETHNRVIAPVIGWDAKKGKVKVSPLARWSDEQVDQYIVDNGVLVNPLVYDGYPSMVRPCTRRVAPGEDPRSGRWAGTNKTECGSTHDLHSPVREEATLMAAPALIALAHGSRDPRSSATVTALVEEVRAQRPDLRVEPAFLELSRPSFQTVVDRLVRAGHDEIVVVPLLLTEAFHAKVDVPSAIAEAAARHEGLQIRATAILGLETCFLEVLDIRMREALKASRVRELDALVLAAAGTTDPLANQAVARLARLWGNHHKLPVSAAYASSTPPATGEAVRAFRAEGRRHIAVASLFLAPGFLPDRARELALEAGAVAVSEPLGAHPEVARTILARYAVGAVELVPV